VVVDDEQGKLPGSKRAGTVYGPRNEDRRAKTEPRGFPVTPSVPVGEFSNRPITNVDMPPAEELAARIERGRSATKSSEIAITARLNQQDHEIAEVKGSVKTIEKNVTGMQLEVAGLKPLVSQLQKSADRLAERDDLHFKATLQVDTATKLDVIDARKLRRQFALKVVGLLGAGGVAAEIVHWLIGKAS
jgi:hypothetical protein